MPLSHKAISRTLLYRNPINHPTVGFLKKSVIQLKGGYRNFPFYEDYDKKFNKTQLHFEGHMNKFEDKQLSILNAYNKEFKGNADEIQEREDKINDIREQRISLDKEFKENKELLITEVTRALKAYILENKAVRKTDAPEYFTENVNVMVKRFIQ